MRRHEIATSTIRREELKCTPTMASILRHLRRLSTPDAPFAHRLQVAVHDVQRVEVRDSRHNLRSVQPGLLLVEDARPVEIMLRVQPLHKQMCTSSVHMLLYPR